MKTLKIRAGYYNTELEAAIAYDLIASELLGDAARLNFPKVGIN